MAEAGHLVASPGKLDSVPPLAARQVQDAQRRTDLEQALDGVDLARGPVLQHRVIQIQVRRAEPGAPPVRVHPSIQLGQAARWRLAPYIDRSAASSSWSSVVPSVGYSASPTDSPPASLVCFSWSTSNMAMAKPPSGAASFFRRASSKARRLPTPVRGSTRAALARRWISLALAMETAAWLARMISRRRWSGVYWCNPIITTTRTPSSCSSKTMGTASMDSSVMGVPSTCRALAWRSASPRTAPRLVSATQPVIPSPTCTARLAAVAPAYSSRLVD